MKIRKYVSKRLKALVLAGLVCFSTLGTAQAADTINLTLEESIQMALDNNRTIKQSVSDVDSARWALHQARRNSGFNLSWSGQATTLSGYSAREAQHAYEQGLSSVRYDRNFYNSFSLSFPLYTGGRIENNIEAAELGVDAADLTLEATRQNIKATTTSAYYRILQCRNLIKVQQERVETLTAHLNNVNAQYRVGTVAKSDVLRSQVELAEAQQNLVTAQNNYDVAVATFNNIVGLPTDTIVNASDDLKYVKYELNLEECTEYALTHRPDGIAANRNVSRARANMQATKAGYRPQVAAVANRAFAGDKLFGTNHTSSDSIAVGVSASWNIFDNFVTEAQVQQAKAALRKAEQLEMQTMEQIQLDVQTYYLNLLAAEKNIYTTHTAVDQAQEDYKIAQVRYSAGVGTNVDVMDAESSLISAQTTYITSLFDYNTSKAMLDQAMGVKVELDVAPYQKGEIPSVVPVRASADTSQNMTAEQASMTKDEKYQSENRSVAANTAEENAAIAAQSAERKGATSLHPVEIPKADRSEPGRIQPVQLPRAERPTSPAQRSVPGPGAGPEATAEAEIAEATR